MSISNIVLTSSNRIRISNGTNQIKISDPEVLVGYFISPTGSDTTGTGTEANPWFTLNKVWTVIAPGDTVYARGGTYAFNSQQSLTGKNGTNGYPIKIWAYKNEIPAFSKSGSYVGNAGITFTGDYFHWKGIEITGYSQDVVSGSIWGMRAENSSYNIFERFNVHHNALGLDIANLGTVAHCTGNIVLNSDFHHNSDPLTSGDPYGNGDGLHIAYVTHPEDINYVSGCRFYWNSDDGFDMFMNDGMVYVDNCWSFYNGYIPDTFTTAGDGMGIKFGTSTDQTRTTIKRKATNCISIKNKAHGFGINDLYGEIVLNNCSAYLNNGTGIHLSTNNLIHHPTNCLSYANTINTELGTNSVAVTNSWQNGIIVDDTDFASVDLSYLIGSRQTNGDLPIISTLHLVSGSDLINAGTDVGLPYSGVAPDIGAFEYGIIDHTTTTTTTIAPVTTSTTTIITLPLTAGNVTIKATGGTFSSWFDFWDNLGNLTGDINCVIDAGTYIETTAPASVGEILNGHTIHVYPSAFPTKTDATDGVIFDFTYNANCLNFSPNGAGTLIIEGINFIFNNTNSNYRVILLQSSPASSTVIIRRNVFKLGFYNLYVNDSNFIVQAYNNFFYDSIRSIHTFVAPAAGSFISNNTIADCTGLGIHANSLACTWDNNLLYNVGVTNCFGVTTATGHNNSSYDATATNFGGAGSANNRISKTADPFTARASNDYTLAASSDPIGNGLNLSASFTDDFFGLTRSTWDIGATKF